MRSSQSKNSFASSYGIRHLAIAFILVTIITVLPFGVINAVIESLNLSTALTIVWLVIAFLVIMRLALKPEASKVWQYSLSQLAVVGTIISLGGFIWISIGFLITAFGFGLVTVILFYFNLGDKDLRRLHKSYVPIHLLSAIVAFGLIYFKCN